MVCKSEQVYYELLISINPNIADIVSQICFELLPCEGVILEEEAYKDLEMISTTKGTLKVFLNADCDYQSALNEQKQLLKSRGFTDEELGSWQCCIKEKPYEDWSKKWKEKWTVTHVSEKITIVPDWIEYSPKKNEVIIRLEPGCAFGTGTHPTTQLCLKAIEKYVRPQDDVADIGMGSGILSICAKKFQANNVYGCDIDETVIDVAKENAVKNNVFCEFELNTVDKINKKYSIVLANILHNVLVQIMPDLKRILEDKGILVLSGILTEKAPLVIEAIYQNDLKIIEQDFINQWTSFVVRK